MVDCRMGFLRYGNSAYVTFRKDGRLWLHDPRHDHATTGAT